MLLNSTMFKKTKDLFPVKQKFLSQNHNLQTVPKIKAKIVHVPLCQPPTPYTHGHCQC